MDLIRQRRSERAPFDRRRRVTKPQLERIVEAAAWAPTAHNMQNFEIVVVDDAAMLQAIGAVESRASAVFLRENLQQLSFSEHELRQKKTGVLADMFPPAWRTPGADFEAIAAESAPTPLRHVLQDAPCLMLVLYDPGKRAPASEGDVLGFISLGCVMENMWLAAQSLGLGLQVLSALSSEAVEAQIRRILGIPAHLKIAYACRLGYPVLADEPVRVRRTPEGFVHRNQYGERGLGGVGVVGQSGAFQPHALLFRP